MTQAFKLAVNICETNGLTPVINDVLLKAKLNTTPDYTLYPAHIW